MLIRTNFNRGVSGSIGATSAVQGAARQVSDYHPASLKGALPRVDQAYWRLPDRHIAVQTADRGLAARAGSSDHLHPATAEGKLQTLAAAVDLDLNPCSGQRP